MSLVKTDSEIKIMKKAAEILAEILKKLKKAVAPGIKTKKLEKEALFWMKKFKVKPNFLGKDGFPSIMCVSVNEVVAHGVPGNYILKEGDIVSLDMGIEYKGYNADMATTVGVGEIDLTKKRLIKVCKKALKLAVKKARKGNTTGDIGNTIERYVKSQGFHVVKKLCGHGIGKKLHEEPQVLNFGKRKKGIKLKKNMVLCIEPMIGVSSGEIVKAEDGFGFKIKDNSPSAHFEAMVKVDEKKGELLAPIC